MTATSPAYTSVRLTTRSMSYSRYRVMAIAMQIGTATIVMLRSGSPMGLFSPM